MTSTSLQKLYAIRNAKKTLLEVANHERKENIYSDLLAFFLKPNEAHELEAKVLTALLKLAETPNFIKVDSPQSVYVSREFSTENSRNRIDLFIHTGNYVIGIENKINHTLKNDLNDYDEILESYAEGVDVVRIILSREKVKIPKEHRDRYKLENNSIVIDGNESKSWKVILYEDLFKELEIDALKDFRLQQLINSTKPFAVSNELNELHEDKKKCLLPLQSKLKLDKRLTKWNIWGGGNAVDEKLSDGCSVYYKFEDSDIQIFAYATFKKTETEYCEIVWHVGLQLNGNIGRGNVSPRLFKLFYKQSSELSNEYKYNTGNGRAGKYREYCKETEIDVIVEELLSLKNLVESNL